MSALSTLTTTSPSTPVKAHRSNGSFVASRGISGSMTGTQCSQSPLMSFTASLLQSTPQHSVKEVTFNAVVKTAFSAFLCCNKFTEKSPGSVGGSNSSMKLAWGDVIFLPDTVAPTHICLTVPTSKTDPFWKGVSLLIAAAPHAATCTVRALQYLYAVDPQPPHAPLFSGSVAS